jgi:hypothetical protein
VPIPADVPDKVLDAIRVHLLHACKTAEEGYRGGSAQEDVLTGALCERLRLEPAKNVNVPSGEVWCFAVQWNKFRVGKEGSREEGEIGADGIVQFEVFKAYGEEVYTKGLLFQAKKEGDPHAKRLRGQVRSMEALAPGSSAVFYYGEAGYRAVASDVLAGRSGSHEVPDPGVAGAPLGEFLAGRFLACEVGTEKLYYDHADETLFVPQRSGAYRRVRTRLDKLAVKIYAGPKGVEELDRPAASVGKRRVTIC